MERLFSIIEKPVTTEKSHRQELDGIYTVMVDSRATKTDVRHAFFHLYGVTVEKVNMVPVRAKYKRRQNGFLVARRKAGVKAVVFLKKGERIADLQKFSTKDKE